MREPIKHTSRAYSFLAWLILPLLLGWLGISYIVGTLAHKPSWSDGAPQENQVAVLPYEATYPAIQKPTHGLITFWFDDAWLSQYFIAEPILKKAQLNAAIAVPTSFIGYDGFLNWAELRSLQKEGWEITNHTVVHDCTMEAWSEEKIKKELTDASQALWKHNLASDHFVSPCGVNSPTLAKVAANLMLSFRGTEPGYNDLFHELDLFDLKVKNITDQTTIKEVQEWVSEARKNNLWLIIVFHQVGEEKEGKPEEYSIDADTFAEVVEYIKNSGVPVVLPSQALSLRQ